jgi:hypothetical protein
MTTTHPVTRRVRTLTGTRKREFNFRVVPPDILLDTASYWDEGNRDQHSVTNFRNGNWRSTPTTAYGTAFKPQTWLADGEVMVTTSMFCGKHMRPTITCREDNVDEVRAWLDIQ